MRSDTVWLCGSTTHTAGRPSASVSALGGTCTPGGADSLMLPVTVDPSASAWGGSMMPTLTWNVRVAASACGATSRTRPVARTDGSLVSAICTSGIARTRADELFGHVEDGVASALTRDASRSSVRRGPPRPVRRRSRSPRRGHRRTGPCSSTDPARCAPGHERHRPGPRRSASACWASSNFARGVQPSCQKLLLPAEGEARLRQHGLGRREIGLRRAQRVLLVLRVEVGRRSGLP